MKVFVSCGWITALPSTALRAASTSASGDASFNRYPETPAWIAPEIAPRDSSIVIRITRVSGDASGSSWWPRCRPSRASERP